MAQGVWGSCSGCVVVHEEDYGLGALLGLGGGRRWRRALTAAARGGACWAWAARRVRRACHGWRGARGCGGACTARGPRAARESTHAPGRGCWGGGHNVVGVGVYLKAHCTVRRVRVFPGLCQGGAVFASDKASVKLLNVTFKANKPVRPPLHSCTVGPVAGSTR